MYYVFTNCVLHLHACFDGKRQYTAWWWWGPDGLRCAVNPQTFGKKHYAKKIDPYTQSKTQSNQKHTENFMREFGGVSWFEICQSGTKFTCLERKNTILLSVFFFLEHQLLWELDFYTTLVKGQNFPLCLCNFCKFPPEIRKVGEKYKEMEVILPNSDRKMTRNMLNYSIRTKKNVHGRFSVG